MGGISHKQCVQAKKIPCPKDREFFYVALRAKLLQLDLAAGLFDLLLQSLGVVLGHALLQGLGSALDSGLGLGQALAGDLADNLDDLDLGSGVEAGCLLYTSPSPRD